MMKKTFLASFLSLLIFFAIGVVLVSAQPGTTNPTGPGTTNPTGPGTNNPTTGINVTLNNPFNCGGIQPCSLFVLMKEIVNKIILPIGGVLAVLAFIYSGFLYVTAQGKETQIANAHRALLYTSVGTAVLLGSWVLANLICTTIGQLGGPICPP
jgi:hypothetical protein